MKRFVFGLLCMGVGFLITYYSAQLVNLFGPSQWAESHLGGTRNMYILTGFSFMVVGFLIWFGMVSV